MKSTTLLSAGAMLSAGVVGTPMPQSGSERSDNSLIPYGTIAPESVIKTSKGDFTVSSRLTDFRGCGDDKKKVIQKAFADTLKLLNAVGIPGDIFNDKPQEVLDYWGPEDNWEKLTVQENFRRAQLMKDQTWLGDWWYDRYFQITCDDPLKRCNDIAKAGVAAYENDQNTKDNAGKYPRINLCDRFFKLATHDQRVKDIKDKNHPSNNVEYLRSQASALLHEMFHSEATTVEGGSSAGISNPKSIDIIPNDAGGDERQKAYGAMRAKFLARMKTPEKRRLVFLNTDNYVYFTLSRFMMAEFKVPYPTEPRASWGTYTIKGEDDPTPPSDGGENSATKDFSTKEELLTDDELYGKKPSPPPEPKEEVQCYDPGKGSGNPSSCYISRDAMISHADAFCGEVDGLATAKLTKGYAQDTYNGAVLSIDSNRKISKDECVKRFRNFIDGCVPANNNPMNWKYGGELRFDGTFYKINVDGGRSCQRKVNDDGSPLQSVIAKCDSFYQAIRDEFWIYGAGFLEDGFGKPLYDQMSHCIGSGVTDWSFEYYDKPDADGYEWKAFGHTPIWQKNCFSPVIKGSGGPDVPCNGSG